MDWVVTLTKEERVSVAGSDRKPLPGANRRDAVPADDQMDVTVVLRRGGGAAGAHEETQRVEDAGANSITRRRAQRRQYTAQSQAAEDDVAGIVQFAARYGLTVIGIHPEQRIVRLRGTAEMLSQAFGVALSTYEMPGETGASYRGREGSISVPADVAASIEAVLGLDNRPQAKPHFKMKEPGSANVVATPHAARAYWAPEVGKLYDFPTESAGDGEAIAVIELAGGYKNSDISQYFQGLGIPTPAVISVGVDGASNSPGDDADGEVVLDIEVAGSIAPHASVVVYFAPNTDAGFYDAISAALADHQHAPSVISISWGGPESGWTGQAMQAMDNLFADASAAGVTVLSAAGDHGAGDGTQDGQAHADFPASSPHNIACGGTRLEAASSTITSETVWNDADGWATGGGVSDVFPVPTWQATAGVPVSINPSRHVGRGIPDVAGNADPATGYWVILNGQTVEVGGTSAVAPLYAGLVARLNSALGKSVGELNQNLYSVAGVAGSYRDITSGNNSVPQSSDGPAVTGYAAGSGWDACTGWGSINGEALLAALRGSSSDTTSPAPLPEE